MKVGFLGPKGTFTEMAARALFPDEELVPCQTIPLSMDKVSSNELDLTVVPIENTIEGSVNITLDYLIHKQRLPIIAGVTVTIAQQFLMHPIQIEKGNQPERVLSHPQALAQCHDFLKETYENAPVEYTNSTASAAEWLATNPAEPVACIANELAAKEYGLTVVHKDIQDYSSNRTRFLVLGRQGEQHTVTAPYIISDRTTLMITLPEDYTGALHQVLSAFAWRKLNLSKIESRPTKTGLGNYYFVIDIDQKMDDTLIPGAISELEVLGCKVELLGSYTCYSLTDLTKKS
ncbi:prephenate dehydratase [Alkalicoccobacillus plakortidis]|uniref:Prephenate dehydratase n=1 Tax=Alkalicoccobacillus plakortidis TaxID=444060 RepID=A0ABT0XL60_9BACI|nr:prephenate dehydratase [Alkalicoccobacillus plakortidis]MCM2676653.1 prephenate dehydratase [Alkalicoccobacillus plakortidis]